VLCKLIRNKGNSQKMYINSSRESKTKTKEYFEKRSGWAGALHPVKSCLVGLVLGALFSVVIQNTTSLLPSYCLNSPQSSIYSWQSTSDEMEVHERGLVKHPKNKWSTPDLFKHNSDFLESHWTWDTKGLKTLKGFITRTLADISTEFLPDDSQTQDLLDCLGPASMNRSILQTVLLFPQWEICFSKKRGLSIANKNQRHIDVDESGIEWDFSLRTASRAHVIPPNGERKLIYQAGFSSVGTRSLTDFWNAAQPKLSVGHWEKTEIARNMVENMLKQLPILGGAYLEQFQVILDPNGFDYREGKTEALFHGCRFFFEVHAHYPRSYFIVNIRPDPWGWIKSKEKHWVGVENWLRNLWFLQWFFHYAEVYIYFSTTFVSDGEQARALVFDIRNDTGAVLSRWTSEKMGVEVSPSVYDDWLKIYKSGNNKKLDGNPAEFLDQILKK